MEIKVTEQELQFLAKTYSDSEISLLITGEQKFTIFHPKAKVPCEILGITKRTVLIRYDLGFWKNLLVKWFVKFENEGIRWDKNQKSLEVAPFLFLPEKEQEATADYSIQEISLEPGSLFIQLGIIPDL